MRIGVTGSGGLIGTALCSELEARAHQVVRIRRPPEPQALESLDAVVHLAGRNIADGRWTVRRKAEIWDSRVRGTQALVETLRNLDRPPATFVCASAVGCYGDRGDEPLDESSAAGAGFFPDLCRAWEHAAQTAERFAARVVMLRIGVVLAAHGGALSRMLTPFRLGLGGRLGSGRQWWSWIALDDLVAATLHVLATPSLAGPVNAVAPSPVTNTEFTRTLARVLRRPAWFPVPSPLLRLALGGLADAALLASARVLPRRLQDSGFSFRWPVLAAALRHGLGLEIPAAAR